MTQNILAALRELDFGDAQDGVVDRVLDLLNESRSPLPHGEQALAVIEMWLGWQTPAMRRLVVIGVIRSADGVAPHVMSLATRLLTTLTDPLTGDELTELLTSPVPAVREWAIRQAHTVPPEPA